MENVIALAVQDMHPSCSETSIRAASRVRRVIPAAFIASFQGTGLSTVKSTPSFGPAYGVTGGTPLSARTASTTRTSNDVPSGHPTWSPPV